MAGVHETLGLIPGTEVGLKAEKRENTDREHLTHPQGQSRSLYIQDRKYSGGILVNIKYVLMINHQQKNSTRNIKWKTSGFQSDTFEYSRFKANTWMGKNHNGDQKNEFSHRSPRTCL